MTSELQKLQTPPAPNLPIAPTTYSGQHFDIFSNVLRLYFNRISDTFRALLGTNGGRFLSIPHISAVNEDSEYATANDTPTLITFDTTTTESGMYLAPGNGVYMEQAGTYNIMYNLQFANTDTTQHTVRVWFRKNGADLAMSATKFSIPPRKTPTVFGYTAATSLLIVELNTNDYIEIWWAVDQAYNPVGPVNGVFLEALPASVSPVVRPSVPSAILTVTFVSAMPT